MLANTDILEAQFDLINEGVIILGAEQAVTKLNKSAELMLNTSSQVAIGKKITEALGTQNGHLIDALQKISLSEPSA